MKMKAMPRRKGYRVLIWAVVSVAALLASPILYLLGDVTYRRWAVESLYERVLASGQVAATELETGWDRMCIATAYCGGRGDLSWDICDRFQGDGLWGVVFFKGDEIVSIRSHTAHVRFKETKLCFQKESNPVFISVGNELLTVVERQ